MIRAVYRKGVIQPLDPLPADWREGQQLEVREPEAAEDANWPPTHEEIEAWAAGVAEAASKISDADHAIVDAVLEEQEAQSKILGRRELERLP